MSAQADLFEPITRARRRAEAGMQRAADATERRVPGWCEMACDAVRRFAAAQAGVFTLEMMRAVLERELPAPHDRRSWGKVAVMAQKRGLIEKVPGRFFPAASSNGSPKPVYRRGQPGWMR